MRTADQVFDDVLALMFSETGDKAELTNGFLSALNLTIGECFDLENGLREAAGKTPLAEPVRILTTAQPVELDFRLLNVIPYGVAGILYTEDEPSDAAVYKNKYEAQREQLTRAKFMPVVDYYG